MSVIIFLLILAVLIFVHELGHFLVAKKSGIRVDEFGIGFPPKIFSKKWGSTLYTLNAIPFGGFVKIFGEDAHSEELSEENKSVSFVHKPRIVQALVLVAGVTFNVIFAWFLISLTFFIGTITALPHNTMGELNDARLIVTEVLVDSPASKAKILPGDTILSISNGTETISKELYPEVVQKFISESKSASLKMVLENENKVQREISVSPTTDLVPGKRVVGVSMEWIGTSKLSLIDSLIQGAKSTWYLVRETTIGLSKFLWDTITFNSDFSQVTGPVGIAKVVKQANDLGFIYLLNITAIISINLAVINLVPFPALDGGRLLFVAIEAIIRRPINPSVVKWSNLIGFALLMILMIAVTSKDITRLFS
ncbi:MAG: RIP metalloprotease RseP [Parcubacteria bacterium C7867-003]|nr:MAG: RIP metalloprotease RseP [Parcubacteria bacterium C7867-003]